MMRTLLLEGLKEEFRDDDARMDGRKEEVACNLLSYFKPSIGTFEIDPEAPQPA